MGEIEQRHKVERRKGMECRTIPDRRQSKIIHLDLMDTLQYGLLDYDGQDKRSGEDRRSGKERRITSTYILE